MTLDSTARSPGPGGRTGDLLSLRARVVPRGVSTANPTVIDSATGSVWTDVDGDDWIDFTGGIGSLNVGAGHPAVVAAITEQAQRLLHTCSHVAWHEPYLRLAERLATMVPIDPPVKVMLCTTGAEAVENAVKIARAATGRPLVVSFSAAFHGRTWMALSLTGKERPYRNGIGPLVAEVRRVPFGEIEPLSELLAAHGEAVGAVIVEPILGEGGFVIPPADFLPRVAELTRAAGAVLIADEVQTGFGRTGRLFACEHTGVRPDLMVLGKSIGGGLPLAAVAGRSELMDAPGPGVLGGTYAGNPVACAASLAVCDLFADGSLLERANALGIHARARLEAAVEAAGVRADVRGLGAMVAVEFFDQAGAPHTAMAAAVQAGCMRRRLLTLRAGMDDNVLRLHCALAIEEELLDRGLDVITDAINEAAPG
ncbi:MAG: aspartate aminotransferase family protein [Candidatus Dormibacteraeota bacterium]|uniref:(S)-3-amino-2-methylpropionate transaminase n=1 Tax=Candidatus Amunia macphersoniae TaxID=3127014 RepID=A0A934NF83_9BACT|nr:aspartate aminotransferase family protein [Candidatus Dormibacteraeota bacterium]